MGEQFDAVRALPPIVGVGKMLADVPVSRGTEHGVGAGVGDGVPVGMTHQARVTLKYHPAQNQLSFARRGKPVNIEPVTYAQARNARR